MLTTAHWYRLDADDAVERLGVPRAGITSAEAARRRELHGPNELPPEARRRPLAILLAQLTHLMILVLVGAAVVSVFVGDL